MQRKETPCGLPSRCVLLRHSAPKVAPKGRRANEDEIHATTGITIDSCFLGGIHLRGGGPQGKGSRTWGQQSQPAKHFSLTNTPLIRGPANCSEMAGN